MVQHRSVRRVPLVSVGIVLVLLAVSPTMIGMLRGFDQLQRGAAPNDIGAGVVVAFHPVFIGCGFLGMLFLLAGLLRHLGWLRG